MELSTQRRLAADILGVGINRVWVDPNRAADVSAAISREDVRRLIRQGAIKAKPELGISRGRFRRRVAKRRRGRRRGVGSRSGTRKARQPKKASWIRTVRPLRARLRELKQEGTINQREYRRLYRMVKGGAFKSRAHLETHLRERGLLKG
ncbi:MAG: 50S ribosomal protein L19e [Candidatus Hadarchaeaceae archaeon]